MALVQSSISIILHVQENSVEQRTGILGQQVESWIWDRRSIEDHQTPSTYYGDTLTWTGPIDGHLSLDYKDGTVHGVEYHDVLKYSQDFQETWTPRVSSGVYTVGSDRLPLYSDYSSTLILDPDDTIDNLATFTIPLDIAEPICIAVYKRDNRLRTTPFKTWKLVDVFTGYLDGNERVDAEPSDVPTFTEMDTNKFEAKLIEDDEEIVLNGPAVYTVGDLTNSSQEVIEALWEGHGESSPGRVIYSKYFPIVGDIEVAALVDDGAGNITVQAYTEIPDFSQTISSDYHYVLDRALGIIYLSGYSHPDEYLSGDIEDDDEYISLKLSSTVLANSIPSVGSIDIDGETITYTSIDNGVLYGLTRAAGAAHSDGDVVVFEQQGDWAGSGEGETATIYIAYEYGPRLDFETTDHQFRSGNYASWINLNPLRRLNSQGVLQLSSTALNLSELILTTSAAQIQTTSTFGPVYFGSDSARLTVTAYDAYGNVVPDIYIYLNILEDNNTLGVGILNSNSKTYVGLSNLAGQIHAIYSAPLNLEESEAIIDNTTIVHDGSDTKVTLPYSNTSVDLSKIWLFQILKVDPYFGTVGFKTTVSDSDTDSYGDYVVVPFQLDPEKYTNGVFYSYDVSGETEFSTIIKRVVLERTLNQAATPDEWDNVTYIYLEDTLPVDYEDDNCWLIPAGAAVWNSETLNGSRVLVYKESLSSPVYRPLYPASRHSDTFSLIYEDVLLPLPDSEDRDNNVGAYAIISNRTARIQATAYDPATGQLISSNTLNILVQLPNSLIGDHAYEGEDSYGFRIVGTSTSASRIGNSNYFTINPIALNVNRMSITANIV